MPTKFDLVAQDDPERRVTQTRRRVSEMLRREKSALPDMLMSTRAGIGYGNNRGGDKKGVLEL